MTPPVSTRIREVDVLRGLAALTVVFSHYLPYWDRYVRDVPVLMPKAAGYYAVKLFFVISGFVIFMTLDHCKRVTDFLVLRASRLYPAYWVSLALVSAVSVLVFGDKFWLSGFVVNATMFQQFFGYPHFDNVYWSLSVELAFYANAAWLFFFGLHRNTRLLTLVWLVLAAVWTVTTHDIGLVTSHGVVAGVQRDWFALLFALDYAPYFAMGVLFYDVARRGWSVVTAALIVLAVAVEFLLASWEGVAVACSVGLVFALAINGYLNILVGRVTLWLGAISYSLYLVHRDLGYHALAWMHDHGVAYPAAIAATAGAALLLATGLTFFVERPALRKLRAWYKGRAELATKRNESVQSEHELSLVNGVAAALATTKKK